jgi:hypothetical protein
VTIETRPALLWTSSRITIYDMKQLIQDMYGTPVGLQRIIYNGRQLDNGYSLAYYNIRTESMINVIERRRGGTYYFTSGQQEFRFLTVDATESVKKVLIFKIKSTSHARRSSSSDLQEYLLQVQKVLLNLYISIKDIRLPRDPPNLMAAIYSSTDDEDSSDSEDRVSSDE